MSDSKQTELGSLVNRAKHLGNMKSNKALVRWSGCFIALQAEESMGAVREGIPGLLTN